MTEAERTITTPEETPDATPDGGTGVEESGVAEPSEQAAPAADGTERAAQGDEPAGPQAVSRRRRRIVTLIGVAALAYLLDLLSKIWVVSSLENHEPVNVFGHYLRLDAIRNAGAAFGMGQGMTIVFTMIATGVIVVIARLSRRLHSLPWAVALGLLLGGAFGNLTDRVFRTPGGFQGRVVDFIAPEHFAVFNLADSAICCGGALIVLLSFRGVDPDGTVHRED
ncbi:signal peptidase II [Streptomyces sp. NPDC008139]|uniref:signal peptidase II n=1 Tax=Streptomyces sp. NPDC008139 TaxID=3364814 RepID=UPI0036EFE886